MHTATKTLSQTHIAIAVAIAIGAAGIAAAIVPPLLNQEKMTEKAAFSCGGYGQSVCLPCQKGLVENELRRCTCSSGETWSGNACIAEKKEPAVVVDATADQKFERGASQVLLGSFRLMLNMHENASYSIKLYGVAGMGGVIFTNVKIRNEEGLFVGSSEGILENGKSITIQALNQGAGAFVGNGKRYKIYADVLKDAALTSDTIYMAGDYNERIELEKYSITEAQKPSYKINVESAKYGSSLGVQIKKEDKSPNAVIGIVGVTLPKGVEYVRGVTFSEIGSKSGIHPGFNRLGLRVTDAQGKSLWNDEWVGDKVWVNASNAFTFRGTYKDGNGSLYLYKGLPTDTELIFSVVALIDDKTSAAFPAMGKLGLSYIPADGNGQRYYHEGRLELQDYKVEIGEIAQKPQIPENQFTVQADMTTMQFSPIPVGIAAAKIGSFAITSSKTSPASLKITFDGLTAGEKYKYQSLFENLVIKNSEGMLVAARKKLEHQETFILDDRIAPYTTKRYIITADVLATAPIIASRLYITAPQKVDLQKFTLEKAKLACANFVYETNPANSENILWEKPNFPKCAKDLDPKQWDVAPWKGYVKTSTSALESDPEKCYDEYHSVYKGVTSVRPNYMAYAKVKTSTGLCK